MDLPAGSGGAGAGGVNVSRPHLSPPRHGGAPPGPPPPPPLQIPLALAQAEGVLGSYASGAGGGAVLPGGGARPLHAAGQWAQGGAERLREQLNTRLQLETLKNHDVKYNLGLAEERQRAVEHARQADDVREKLQAAEETVLVQEKEIKALKEGQEYILSQYEDLGRQFHKKVQESAELEARQTEKNGLLGTMDTMRADLKQEMGLMEVRLKERETALLDEAATFRARLQELDALSDEKDLLLQKMEGQVEFARTSLEHAVGNNTRLDETVQRLEGELALEKQHTNGLTLEAGRLEKAVQKGAEMYIEACDEVERWRPLVAAAALAQQQQQQQGVLQTLVQAAAGPGAATSHHAAAAVAVAEASAATKIGRLTTLLEQRDAEVAALVAEKSAVDARAAELARQKEALVRIVEAQSPPRSQAQQQQQQPPTYLPQMQHPTQQQPAYALPPPPQPAAFQQQFPPQQHFPDPAKQYQQQQQQQQYQYQQQQPLHQQTHLQPPGSPSPFLHTPPHSLGDAQQQQPQPQPQPSHPLSHPRGDVAALTSMVSALQSELSSLQRQAAAAAPASAPAAPSGAPPHHHHHYPPPSSQTAQRRSASPAVEPLAMKMQAAIEDLHRLTSPHGEVSPPPRPLGLPPPPAAPAAAPLLPSPAAPAAVPAPPATTPQELWARLLQARQRGAASCPEGAAYERAMVQLCAKGQLTTYHHALGAQEAFAEVARVKAAAFRGTALRPSGTGPCGASVLQTVEVDGPGSCVPDSVAFETDLGGVKGLCMIVATWTIPSAPDSGFAVTGTDTIYIQQAVAGQQPRQPPPVLPASDAGSTAEAAPTLAPDSVAAFTGGAPQAQADSVSSPSLSVLKHCVAVYVTAVTLPATATAAVAYGAPPVSEAAAAAAAGPRAAVAPPSHAGSDADQLLSVSMRGSQVSAGAPVAAAGGAGGAAEDGYERVSSEELGRLRRQVVSHENIAFHRELAELRAAAVRSAEDQPRLRDLQQQVEDAHADIDRKAAALHALREDQLRVEFWQGKVRGLVEENEALRQDAGRIRAHLVRHEVAAGLGGGGAPQDEAAAAAPTTTSPRSPGVSVMQDLTHTVDDLAHTASSVPALKAQVRTLGEQLAAERQRAHTAVQELAALRGQLQERDARVADAERRLQAGASAFEEHKAAAATRLAEEGEAQASLRREAGAAAAQADEGRRAAEEAEQAKVQLQERLRQAEVGRRLAEDKLAALQRQLSALTVT